MIDQANKLHSLTAVSVEIVSQFPEVLCRMTRSK